MKILGIETSCDETAAAVVEDGTKVLSSQVSSSEELQKKWGGIMPEQAAREQVKYIVPVIEETFNDTRILRYYDITRKKQNKNSLSIPISQYLSIVDAIAVTIGPGLIGSLLIGIETAKTLSMVFQKPIIPVNHLIGHIYANFINKLYSKAGGTLRGTPKKGPLLGVLGGKSVTGPAFPALCLLVSGGHTELVLMPKHGDHQVVGQTLDDAAGECFDKCSRLLGLGYPGGPAVEAVASKLKIKNEKLKMIINNLKLNLPRPMINDKSFNFSFSGLKTAVLYLIKKNNPSYILNHKSYIAYELQEAITDVLVAKTLKAAKKFQVKSILVGGGVASNQRLRDKFSSYILDHKSYINLCFPDKNLCTDNAVGIASSAFFNYKPLPWSNIKPNPSLTI